MVRKFGSVKRVARGVFGPSKKTLLRVKAGLEKQHQLAMAKGTMLAFEAKKPTTAREIPSVIKSLFENLNSISGEFHDKKSRVVVRISTKYALDAMNISGEKRARVFKTMEKMCNQHRLRKNGVAPSFVDELIEELGETKMCLFAALLKSKVIKAKKYI